MNDVLLSRRALAITLIGGALALTACGSGEAADRLSSPTVDETVDSDQPASDPAPLEPSPTDTDPNVEADSDATLIGTANVGGPIVDATPHPIDAIDIAESFPEQLIVRFTSGDPNCTAATAAATADGDRVLVALEVGITEDALAKSCRAGVFENSVTIGLDQGLGGRDVVPAPV